MTYSVFCGTLSLTQSINHVAHCAVYIAAVVSGESGDDIYEQVKVVIEEQAGPSVWVPTNQPL